MTLNLILDIVMIIFLGFTMSFAFVLNRNLVNLRATKGEFEDLVKKLTGAMTAAETSIRNLKLAAQEVGGELDDQIQKGLGLSHELQFMVESGDSLARRLEGAAVATPKPKHASTNDIIDEHAPRAMAEPAARPTRSIEDVAVRALMDKASTAAAEPPLAKTGGLSQPRAAANPFAAKPRSRAESQLMADFARIEAARHDQDHDQDKAAG